MLSEYGCNVIKPRIFQEVEALYSHNMSSIFSGGLVYEFTQGPNEYGLVDIDGAGNAFINGEFDTLRQKFSQIPDAEPALSQDTLPRPKCDATYPNIYTGMPIPDSFGTDMIAHGIFARRGELIDIHPSNITIKQSIFDSSDMEIKNKEIKAVADHIPLVVLREQMKPKAGAPGRQAPQTVQPAAPASSGTDKNPSTVIDSGLKDTHRQASMTPGEKTSTATRGALPAVTTLMLVCILTHFF